MVKHPVVKNIYTNKDHNECKTVPICKTIKDPKTVAVERCHSTTERRNPNKRVVDDIIMAQ